MYNLQIKNHVLTIFEADGTELLKSTILEPELELEIHGIYGVIEFNDSQSIVAVTDAKLVGEVEHSDVFEIKKVEVFLMKGNYNYHLKRSIQDFFRLPGMYFSQYPLYKRANIKHDSVFRFNEIPRKNFLKLFTSKDSSPLMLDCIQGFYGKFQDLTLIARRCPARIGTRFFSRGIDDHGFPSNFVETEQKIRNQNSYIQIRGSIPLKWRHKIGYAYTPPIEIIDSKKFALSHQLLEKIYKKDIIYLNLIHETGSEGPLYEAFNKALTKNNLNFFNYNFKKNISKRNFPFDFKKSGFTGNKIEQKTVIRTNCIDCLDRTNAMQSEIGKQILGLQLKDTRIEDQASIDKYTEAHHKLYKECGNMLSIQYAGTKAMSSHAIGINSGSIKGALADLSLGLTRYTINRMAHGSLNDSYGIVTGIKTNGNVLTATPTKIILLRLCFYFTLILGILGKNVKYFNTHKISKVCLILLMIYFFPVAVADKLS